MDNMLGKHRGYLEFSVTAFGQNRVGHLLELQKSDQDRLESILSTKVKLPGAIIEEIKDDIVGRITEKLGDLGKAEAQSKRDSLGRILEMFWYFLQMIRGQQAKWTIKFLQDGKEPLQGCPFDRNNMDCDDQANRDSVEKFHFSSPEIPTVRCPIAVKIAWYVRCWYG
ncbi:MAG: hypothetical protein M1813_007685 [Trichoglossum hirsutum]|nr:MAG: hypothetical protein M1813_007685 [Trichoglossum hirsutum]